MRTAAAAAEGLEPSVGVIRSRELLRKLLSAPTGRGGRGGMKGLIINSLAVCDSEHESLCSEENLTETHFCK